MEELIREYNLQKVEGSDYETWEFYTEFLSTKMLKELLQNYRVVTIFAEPNSTMRVVITPLPY